MWFDGVQRFRGLVAFFLAFLCAGSLGAQAASFSSCVASLKNQAVKAGVSPQVAERMLSGARYDEKVVRFSRSQPEYETPIWDYMAFLVDPKRISDGKARLKKARPDPGRGGKTLRCRQACGGCRLGY